MSTRANETLWALTEKEKQTLRLIVRGHDAKSIARSLGLSVHTVNERLRDVRRKMAVSSSREAARLLLQVEDGSLDSVAPNSFGDIKIGADPTHRAVDQESAPTGGARQAHRPSWMIIGVFFMTLALGLLAFTALPPLALTAPPTPMAARAAPNPQVVNAARHFLILLDQRRWEESYQATGASFRALNTAEVWAAASEKARLPLGAMITRTFASQENLPAPPAGYEVVKFRTRFANRAEALETVTLDREGESWRVVGVMIE
jgi:DNA-binding CsgD family transcriptional regulator